MPTSQSTIVSERVPKPGGDRNFGRQPGVPLVWDRGGSSVLSMAG